MDENSEKDVKVYTFIGPTGVGKTTTISKLALRLVCKNPINNRVNLATSDTYRVGAYEQLKIFSEVINSPFKMLFNSSHVNKFIKKLKDDTKSGNRDKLASVIENIILNQPVPVGTGLPGLLVKVTGPLAEQKSRKEFGKVGKEKK